MPSLHSPPAPGAHLLPLYEAQSCDLAEDRELGQLQHHTASWMGAASMSYQCLLCPPSRSQQRVSCCVAITHRCVQSRHPHCLSEAGACAPLTSSPAALPEPPCLHGDTPWSPGPGGQGDWSYRLPRDCNNWEGCLQQDTTPRELHQHNPSFCEENSYLLALEL